MRINNHQENRYVDIDLLVEEAFKKYEAVFFSEIEGQIFIFRPLTRKEYRDILENQNMDDYSKQDAICKQVLLYPENFDFDECSAGLPDILFKDILEKSCLDVESTFYLLKIQREEAENLSSEMTCIIAEAFPSYTIEEIESWNNFKFIKIYAQAEWVLKNIRGVVFEVDVADYLAKVANISDEELVSLGFKEEEPAPQPQSFKEQQVQQPKRQVQPSSNNSNQKMSPEQMRAYQEFVRQHPEFADAMQYDAAFTGMETMSADTTNPALRPGWYRNH